MTNIVISEFEKIKRYNILWFGIAAVFFVSALAVVQSSPEGGTITYKAFSENIIWNNFSLGFPFIITLTGGYIINREYTDDTLKSIMTIPVSFQKLLFGKLIVTGVLTIVFGIFSFVCTVTSSLFLLRCTDMNSAGIGYSLLQICAVAFFNFIAVAPLIVGFSRKRDYFFAGVGLAFFYGFCGIFVAGRNLTDFYPITAGLGIIGYSGQGTEVSHPFMGGIVLSLMVLLTVVLIATCPNYEKVMAVTANKNRDRRKDGPAPSFFSTEPAQKECEELGVFLGSQKAGGAQAGQKSVELRHDIGRTGRVRHRRGRCDGAGGTGRDGKV
ncbi:MAG: ABC transporter permease [Eubacteriales bacterium]|nr:ABC transporter permease [Eubacteriales bacterium]